MGKGSQTVWRGLASSSWEKGVCEDSGRQQVGLGGRLWGRTFRAVWLGMGLLLAAGALSAALATTHPGGGTSAGTDGVANFTATLWDMGNLLVLPLVAGGAMLGGFGGSGEQRGFNYAKAGGGVVVGAGVAFTPAIVTTLLTGANAAGAGFYPVALPAVKRGGVADAAVLFVLTAMALGLRQLWQTRERSHHVDAGTLSNRGR